MSDQPETDPKEIGGVLNRVNRLGTTTERLFSRLYAGLTRRSKLQTQEHPQIHLNAQLQEMLKKREMEIERFNAILGKIDEGIIMQDLEGRIVLMNNGARNLLGSQKNVWDTELGTLFDAYREVVTVDTELAPLGEPTRIQANNRILAAQLAAVADSHGQRLGTMIVLRDVTRDALAERLKNQFILGISHELNTPMTVIKGMSELLAAQPEDQPANRHFLEKLTRNVDILNSMVVELLDLSEMGAGNFSIRQDEVNLENLVWSVVKGKAHEINRAKLRIGVMINGYQKLRVIGDDERLRWALGHLVQNSARYTEAGGEITVKVGFTGENRIAIHVVDTGVGISEKDLPHVFERFYRGEPRTPSGKLLDPRGLGQGLFVARTVIDAHKGYLTVKSEQGKGSRFTLVLPAAV